MSQSAKDLPEGSRFQVLLNPIRDLAANWGIDVAKELTQYAETLGIDLSDGNEGSDALEEDPVAVDFAEAALLVQGSTSIYSRKVEHLYNLVYVAVTAMNQGQGRLQGSTSEAGQPSSEDPDADALFNADEIDFLSLDDDIPQVDNKAITLKPENDQHDSSRDDTCLPPIPPMLMQNTGGQTDHVGGVGYKICTAHTHSSGALIMEGCPEVDENLDAIIPSTPDHHDVHENTENEPTNDFADNFDDIGDDLVPVENSELGGHGAYPNGAMEDIAVVGSRAIKDAAALYGVTGKHQPTKRRPKPKKDPFYMLNPHEETPFLIKPLRVGKTYRHPSSKPPPDSTLACWNSSSQHLDLSDFILGEMSRKSTIKQHVTFEAIRPAFKECLKERSLQQRRRALLQSKFFAVNNDVTNEDGQIADSLENALILDNSGFSDIDDDDNLGSVEDIPEADRHDPLQDEFHLSPDLGPLPERQGSQLEDHLVNVATSYEETCRRHLEKTAWMWEQRSTDMNLAKRVEEWSNRIQPILDEEERRTEFDIDVYGQNILRNFTRQFVASKCRESNLSGLFETPHRFEVCRIFLSVLQLANNFSVEILGSNGNIVEASDPMLKLLRHTEDGSIEAGKQQEGTTSPKKRTPKKTTKRTRTPGSTPQSQRRLPLRPRIMN